jgi:hypothetical protein
MICVYENLVVPGVVKANVCLETTLMAVISAAKHQKGRAEVSQPPSSGDSKLWSSRRAYETVVFIQVSVSSRGLGSGRC